MIELRPYQRGALDALYAYWQGGGGNALIDMPTGTGKSVVIATLLRETLGQFSDMRALMLVHVRELVAQNSTALLRTWPQAPLGINSAGLGRRDQASKILFANVQSVFRHNDLGQRDLIIVDESHLVPKSGDGMYLTLLEKLRERVPDLRVVGFTATPYRLDSGRLDQGDGRLFDDIVYSYGLAEAVADGWLSPLVSKATGSEIDVSGVARRGGEFVTGQLEQAADRASVVDAACDEIVARGADRKAWLAFCSGVEHAVHVRDALRARGIAAETVTGKTPGAERASIFQTFREGRLRCLTGCNVFTTGFDVPQIDLIATLRPTLSTGLYVQMLGRGTRLAAGKTDCLVLSYDGNVRRHGPVDAIAVTGRDNGAKASTAVMPETVRAKVCPVCGTYNSLMTFTCVTCGHEWPKPQPKHETRADTAPVMAGCGPAWLPVDAVKFIRHEKLDGPPSMRVEYLCGLQCYREWVTFEHKGFARAKAEAWWRAMQGQMPVPTTVAEALARQDELATPTHVTIQRDGKWWRVTGYRLDDREIDERFRVRRISIEIAA